ncbi:MAG TPA: DUF1573 domain-containing protein [Anseongella sp.]
MKKLVLLASVLFLTVFSASAQKEADANKPEFKFEKEVYDFGSLTEGEVATHEFKFKNVGKEPLVITNVIPSCGCTTPKWSKEPIAPGKSGVITVSYDTKGRPTPFSKNVTIHSNAKTPTKVLYIKGEVKAKPQS